MISILSPAQALASVARSVLLPDSYSEEVVSDELLAQATRRAIGIMAPCATYELIRAIVRTFQGTAASEEVLAERVAAIVEELIVYGDILEMKDASTGFSGGIDNFVLRPAPLSFVARRNGTVALIGVAGDRLTPLTGDLIAQTRHQRTLRIIEEAPEELLATLIELGMLKLPEKTWLRIPISGPYPSSAE